MPAGYFRRVALTVGGSLVSVALAGCLSSDRNNNTTSRPDSHSIGDSASIGQGTVTVQRISTQQMLAVLKAGVHTEIYGEAETQYVTTDVEIDGMEKPTQTIREAIHLSLDSTDYDVVEKDLTRNMNEENTVSIAFAVSTESSPSDGEVF